MINNLKPVQQGTKNLPTQSNEHGFGDLLKAMECFRHAVRYDFDKAKEEKIKSEDAPLNTKKDLFIEI